jgi:hypothetical protein
MNSEDKGWFKALASYDHMLDFEPRDFLMGLHRHHSDIRPALNHDVTNGVSATKIRSDSFHSIILRRLRVKCLAGTLYLSLYHDDEDPTYVAESRHFSVTDDLIVANYKLATRTIKYLKYLTLPYDFNRTKSHV